MAGTRPGILHHFRLDLEAAELIEHKFEAELDPQCLQHLLVSNRGKISGNSELSECEQSCADIICTANSKANRKGIQTHIHSTQKQ